MVKVYFKIAGMILGALAIQIGGLHDWREALTPIFIAGCFAVISVVFTALATDPSGSTLPTPDRVDPKRFTGTERNGV